MEGSTRELWKECRLTISWRSSERKHERDQSTFPTSSEATIHSNDSANITRSITRKAWWTRRLRITSTALKASGASLNIFSTTTVVFPNTTFRCILKKLSTDSITEKTTYSNSLSASILVTFLPNYHHLLTGSGL